MRDEPFEAAAELFVALVARVPPDAWDRPGLGDWDVRALVGHTSRSFTTVLTYLDDRPEASDVGTAGDYYAATSRFLAAADPEAVAERGRAAGRALGDDPLAAVSDLWDRTVARLVDARPDDLLRTIVGGMRVRDYLPTRVLELVVHSRDLARALGLGLGVPDELVRAVTTLAVDAAVAQGEGGRVLDALVGRGTLPAGFSVV
ncbi:maleylpyruvate isomerase family mycothiol-dependent enzyme [Luteimicrobium subarcticum]|uniref:Uncharacterized protein (TIGR03083 family) n=1 Tax=Luteimicrobium subarcticum TaxID=620910 RepID=A0A2M8WTJ9_9MICO|nr:maleylpyruvate isomerase N-terminal domain-containing protein [Luteimicrobium subarcticum]PJI94208.1 uncharacterized protein (TIGR03083 family) [Luteimicrobium subarcticum]